MNARAILTGIRPKHINVRKQCNFGRKDPELKLVDARFIRRLKDWVDRKRGMKRLRLRMDDGCKDDVMYDREE